MMYLVRPALPVLLLAVSIACGGDSTPAPAATAAPAVDPATAGTVTAVVKFDGAVPPPAMQRLDGDPKCVTENGSPERADESLVVGNNQGLQNVFVYVKGGLGGYAFPVPTEAVVLDQDKCRYTPRVLGVRVGQPLSIRNSDPLLHNVRANGQINQGFNMSTPVEGVTFERTFATSEVMVPFKCDVHAWMTAYVGVLDHPYFGTTASDGKVVLANLPPGTYTIEAWHETLGMKTGQVTIAAKESKDVAFTFAR
jgi:plastocyanin